MASSILLRKSKSINTNRRFSTAATKKSAANSINETLKWSDGNDIARVGLGTWRSPTNQVYQAVKYAVEHGYRHIDCASVYENQAEVGRAFTEIFQKNQVKRQQLYVVSKLWNTDHSPEHVELALKQTLSDLKLDYLDLYLIHWPVAFAKRGNKLTPLTSQGHTEIVNISLKDTWQAMEQLVRKGLVRSIGVSNYNIEEINDCVKYATIQPVTNQVECHPYLPQDPLRSVCGQHHMILTSYSPLGSSGLHAPNVKIPLTEHPTLQALSQRYQKSVAQILIRWNIQKGNVVIPKSVTPERIKSNIQVYDFELSDQDMQQIALLGMPPKRLLNPSSFRAPPAPFFSD